MTSPSSSSSALSVTPGSPNLAPAPPKPSATRSFSGCRRCREKKVKCDETRPRCKRCVRLDEECDYRRLPRKQYVRKAARKAAARTTSTDTGGSLPGDPHIPSTPQPSEAGRLSASSYPRPAYHRGSVDVGGSGSWAGSEQASLGHAHDSNSPTPSDLALAGELAPECQEILLPFDYSAIRFFCSFFSSEGDTKVPEYSGPMVVWMLARKSPMVLHMVCAMGGQKWCAQNPSFPETRARQMQAIEHYGAGLRLVLAISQTSDDGTTLECILATFWLMILYELKFGDGCGVGLNTHLQGVASLIQGRLRHVHLEFDTADDDAEARDDGLPLQTERERLSPVSCKIVVWLALLDGGAVMNGFGGAFSDLLGRAVPGITEEPVRLRLRCLRTLQMRSGLVNDQIWGRAYPQHHLIDDMQNAHLACLYAESGQLRYLLGKLCAAEHAAGGPDQAFRESVATGIRLVGTRYRELIQVSGRLELPREGLQRQFVAMARFVIPFYYAVVLCYLRLVRGDGPLAVKQREALGYIMTLAFKSLREQGQAALTRLAWPLLVAALESDDIVHRTWILERFDELAKRGENHRRALEALQIAFAEQDMDERKIAYWDLIRRDDVGRFLI